MERLLGCISLQALAGNPRTAVYATALTRLTQGKKEASYAVHPVVYEITRSALLSLLISSALYYSWRLTTADIAHLCARACFENLEERHAWR